jgi:hypothetical protein
LKKAGMFREGRGRQLLPLKSGWSDNFEYATKRMTETELQIKSINQVQKCGFYFANCNKVLLEIIALPLF